ncbi:MAG: DUF4011 domain-containing protein [Planctomycetes bacterium]|nr:DUF4011 domain-containing protein [Planctomycetota bacterium]
MNAPAPQRPTIEVDYDPRVHYALHQNDVPVVKEIRLTNGSDEDLHDLTVTVTIGGVLGRDWTRRLDVLRAGTTWNLHATDLALDPERLRNQEEREMAELVVTVTTGAGPTEEELCRSSHRIEVLAFREWGGLRTLPELLAAFVLPNHPAIEGLLARTSTRLAQAIGDGSLLGYQARDPGRVRATVAAAYRALQDCELRYANPPASFESEGQKVRLPDDVLRARLGTCLDLALLAAALLEQIGLNPLVVVVQGHAFVAVWLVDESFPECAVVDGMRLRKRVDIGDVVAFEATGVTVDGLPSFDDAVGAARRRLDDLDTFHCAIDVRQAHQVQKIRPLPTRTAGADAPAKKMADHAAPTAEAPSEPSHAAPASTVAAPAPEPEPPLEPRQARIEAWKRRLLDLTFRNRLLAFRETKRTVPLLCTDAAALEDAMASGSWFVCVPRPEVERGVDEAAGDVPGEGPATVEQLRVGIAREALASRRLVTGLSATELDRRSLEIWRQHRAGLEEAGANTLYLAVGMLRYREAAHSRVERLAPLLLLPLEMERRSVREGFRLRIADEEPHVNVTLLEKLRLEHGVDVAGLDELPEDDDGYDVPSILQRFRRAVLDLDGFEVRDEVWIAVFSFQKFLMWRDLQARSDDLLRNPVVAHLVERAGEPYEADAVFPDPTGLDETHAPSDTLCPLDADSSQLAAVFASEQGRTFVLEGPPGTGKSQTITNLIAQNLAQGRRVLFVSEKRAALEVVRERLGRVGLAEFCLELHSDKASRQEVVAQLCSYLEVVREREPAEWERLAGELGAERVALNDYVRAIHAPRSFGDSVYRVTSALVGLRDAPRVALDVGPPDALGAGRVADWRRAVERAAAALRAVGRVAGHPLGAVRRTEWHATLSDEVDAALAHVADAIDGHRSSCERVAERLGVPVDALTRERTARLEDVAAAVRNAPGIARELVAAPGWTALRERAAAAIEAGRAKDELRTHVRRAFADGVLELDLDDLLARARRAARSMWPLSWLRGRGVRAELRPVLADGGRLGAASEVVRHLEQALDLRARTRALAAADHDGARLFGPLLWASGDPGAGGFERLGEALEHTARLRTASLRLRDGLPDGVRDDVAARIADLASDAQDELDAGAPLGRLLAEHAASAERLRAALGALDALLELDHAAWDADGPWLPALVERVAGWRARHRELLRDWMFWREARDGADALGLGPLLAAVERGELSADRLGPAFERSFREAWWNATHDAEPVLRRFHGPDHQRRIERFAKLDRQAIELARKLVRARLASRLPDGGAFVADSSEVGVLKREKEKKRRHLPIRRLFERIPNLLPRLKPCVLMSPLSVAQYLDPATPPFDLVVFDEASQITPWDAVGVLARGRAAIVVGDSRQLPPTSFFQKVEDEEAVDDLDVEELESVLDECNAAGFSSMRLRWHYRSRHESLIAFSNYHYYENRLHTFPSPIDEPARLGVSLVPVPGGVYDRSKSRTNRAEAESVVGDLLARIRRDGDRYTHGVVTFSRAQQELVEDLIDQARGREPSLRALLHGRRGGVRQEPRERAG